MKNLLNGVLGFVLFIVLLLGIALGIDYLVTKSHAYEVVSITCTYKNDTKGVEFDTVEGGPFSYTNKLNDMNMTVYIKDTSKFSETEDFINFKKDDKNVLYSLKCSKK